MLRTASTIAALIGLMGAGTAHAAQSITSSAAALNFSFSVNGSKDTLANQVYATGVAPPAYNKKTTLPSYTVSKTYSDTIKLQANATTVTSTAVSAGTKAGGGITANASSSIASFNGTVSSAAGTAVTVAMKRMSSKASLSLTKTGAGTAKGSVSIGSVTLNAPLFGINNVTFSGSPTPNQVLYHNQDNSVVVYANRQVITKVNGKTTGITVSALEIVANNYKYSPYTINGDLSLGASTAKKK